jgi:hypothetical protein
MYSQTFKIKPSIEIINKLLDCIGLSGLDCGEEFTLKKLVENNVVEKFKTIEPELVPFYVPCKARKYLNKYEVKNIITIVRQFLKTCAHNFETKEKYSNKRKFLIYKIVKNRVEEEEPNQENYVLTFN